MELLLDNDAAAADGVTLVPEPQRLHDTIRRLTIARDIVPVLMGSAFRNKGVQPLLDAIVQYLPSPLDIVYYARDNDNDGAEVAITADPDAPPVVMAFKLVEESFGQLTYARVYQGHVRKGTVLRNTRVRRTTRVGRMVRMHANDREDVDAAGPGDIVAFIGVECASGDTFCDDRLNYALENILTPEPVISLAIATAKGADRDRLSKALARFVREDPTFHVRSDPESGETIIAGVGELQLDIYVERIRREYGCQVVTGAPRVNYREAPTRPATFNYRHRKQTGGSGQYGHVIGRLEPLPEDAAADYEFENEVTGGRIPTEYIPSCDKGFQAARMNGRGAGYAVVRVGMVLEAGTSHAVDSSDLAFQVAAREAFKQAYAESRPAILEPIMKVEVEVPTELQGGVVGDLTSRRGVIHGTDIRADVTVIIADVPLATMFGYATDLRSMTQGREHFRCSSGTTGGAARRAEKSWRRRKPPVANARGCGLGSPTMWGAGAPRVPTGAAPPPLPFMSREGHKPAPGAPTTLVLREARPVFDDCRGPFPVALSLLGTLCRYDSLRPWHGRRVLCAGRAKVQSACAQTWGDDSGSGVVCVICARIPSWHGHFERSRCWPSSPSSTSSTWP
jgi:elongation factor G